MRKSPLSVALVALLALAPSACRDSENGATGSAPTTAPLATSGFAAIPGIVAEVEPSVVAVLTDLGEGSGVVWNAEGLVLTNHHVVVDARSIELAFADGERAPAEVVATDPLTDLALLRTERRDLPAATFADDLPVIGEMAIAIGNPLGFENTVTAGIISGLHRSIPGSALQTQALVDLLQTDAAISPGNSGGALVDGDGEVVGINVAYIPPQARAVSLGFAIPAPTVTDAARQLLETGSVRHAFFGIQPGPLTPQVARLLDVDVDGGVLVLDVVEEGPAEMAGIRPGDVIVTVDGTEVDAVESFLGELRRQEPGDRLRIGLVREDERLEVTVVLDER